MCLAVPMRLIEKRDTRGTAEAGGVRREVSLELLDDVSPGDYVIVHAGFAIQKLDEQAARDTLALLDEMGQAMRSEIREIRG